MSNAIKFSNMNGKIQPRLEQKPCEQAVTSTVSKTEGAGLGMSITKNIVDLMGGTIAVAG